MVPENPAAANGRKISLHVVVLPALTSDRAPDPLFYFAGGPGGAASDDTASLFHNFAVLNQRHDIVLIDQRGTGGSGQVACSFGYTTKTDSDIKAGVARCLTSIKGKADPQFYTTPISVDDFDRVRAALGYDKIDVYGVSYGVSSALDYIQRHGSHVRSALLESGSLLDVHLWERVPVSAQHAMNELFDRCASDSACAAAYPNLKADFATITASLSSGPVTYDYVDPASGKKTPVTIDIATLMNFVIDGYLRSVQSSAALPKAVHAAVLGDWNDFLQAYVASSSPSPDLVMALTIECSDEWARRDASTILALGTGSAFTAAELANANFTNTQCKYWPRAIGARGPVYSTAPIVFLNGTADPVDPPENVAGAASTMPNSLVVPVSGLGHAVITQDETGCLLDKATTFLDIGRPSTLASWACPLAVPSFVTQ